MKAVLEGRAVELEGNIGVRLSWAWAVAFFVVGIAGFLPNPLFGANSAVVTDIAHDIVHIVTAMAFGAMALLGNIASTRFMKTFGVVYLLVGTLGFVTLAGAPTGHLLGVIHINNVANFLHVGSGAGILASGLFAASRSRVRVA